MGKFVRIAGQEGVPSQGQGKWREGDWERRFPAIYEYLSDPGDDPAKPRQGATLMLMCDAGCLKVWVHDRDNLRAAWLSSTSLEGLLCSIEEGLQDDDLPWRPTKTTRKGK